MTSIECDHCDTYFRSQYTIYFFVCFSSTQAIQQHQKTILEQYFEQEISTCCDNRGSQQCVYATKSRRKAKANNGCYGTQHGRVCKWHTQGLDGRTCLVDIYSGNEWKSCVTGKKKRRRRKEEKRKNVRVWLQRILNITYIYIYSIPLRDFFCINSASMFVSVYMCILMTAYGYMDTVNQIESLREGRWNVVAPLRNGDACAKIFLLWGKI